MAEAPLTLHARLRETLRRQILEGTLKAQDKLPTEAELSAAHQVSRITVRQALSALQQEGLIVRHQGKGAFVSAPARASQRLDRLQGLGEALAAQGRAVHGTRLRMRRVMASAEVAMALGLAARAEVWHMVSLRYLEREPVSLNSSYFPEVLGARVARLDLSGRDLIEVLEKELRLDVATAQLEISATAMPAREGKLLRAPEGAPALRVQRILRSTDGQALQFETSTYRADSFSYQLTLTR